MWSLTDMWSVSSFMVLSSLFGTVLQLHCQSPTIAK